MDCEPTSNQNQPGGAECRALGRPVGIASVAEALLRSPGRIAFEVRNGDRRLLAAALAAVAALCFLGYGVTVGTFSGGGQLWAAPVKVAGGIALCALICFPSLVVFSLLSGSEASLPEIATLLAGTVALAGLLLVGFGPVAWVFSQSTESVAFMGGLHLFFWVVALRYGVRFLCAAAGAVQGGGRHLLVWAAIFALVSLQMMTTLRPIVGSGERLLQGEKKFFLTHWAETLDEGPRKRGR